MQLLWRVRKSCLITYLSDKIGNPGRGLQVLCQHTSHCTMKYSRESEGLLLWEMKCYSLVWHSPWVICFAGSCSRCSLYSTLPVQKLQGHAQQYQWWISTSSDLRCPMGNKLRCVASNYGESTSMLLSQRWWRWGDINYTFDSVCINCGYTSSMVFYLLLRLMPPIQLMKTFRAVLTMPPK